MKQTELTVYDLENLNETAEYIVSSAQFSLYQYNGEGEYILSELSREERQVALDKWVTGMEENYLCFRSNRELRKRTFQDALYMTHGEIKEKYLKEHLTTLRNILRKGTMELGFTVSDTVPDSYLDELLAMRWKENLKLWTMQWTKDDKK